MIEIKIAQPQDVDFVYQCICDLENQSFNKTVFKSIYDDNIKNTNIIYLVAHDEKPVGFISCHIQPLLHHCGLIAEIQELYVIEEKRNQKIGSQLLRELKEKLKNKNVLQIEVVSNLKRLDTHRFYEREGFMRTSYKFVLIN
jgi:PhnO protein